MIDDATFAAPIQKATFYHAGCPICISAEERFVHALNPSEYSVEVVHLGTDTTWVAEAEAKGVKSVPALVIADEVFHINFGASLDALK